MKAMVISDLHVPYHDVEAINLTTEFMSDYKPDILLINGDLIDFYAISSFVKLESSDFKREIKETKKVLESIRDVYDGQVVVIQGNHEFRMAKYINTNAKELAQLDVLRVDNLLNLNTYNMEYIPSTNRSCQYVFNSGEAEVAIGHYNKVSKFAGYTGKALLHDMGMNLIQGHTHRLANYMETKANGRTLHGIESGCLCDLKADYVTNPNWQQGFVTFELTDDFYPTVYQIKKGRII